MSEKRFELRNYGNEEEIQEIIDKQGKSFFTWEDIEKKLNQLSEENEQLKAQISIFEEFCELNDFNIDFGEFCSAEECPYNDDNPIDCQYCMFIKGD